MIIYKIRNFEHFSIERLYIIYCIKKQQIYKSLDSAPADSRYSKGMHKSSLAVIFHNLFSPICIMSLLR